MTRNKHLRVKRILPDVFFVVYKVPSAAHGLGKARTHGLVSILQMKKYSVGDSIENLKFM